MAKTILITGAGSGFGEASAIGLARNGHKVIATAQFSPEAEERNYSKIQERFQYQRSASGAVTPCPRK